MKAKLQLLILTFLFSLVGMAQTGPGEIDNSFNFSGVGAYGGTLPPAYQPTADGNVYKSKVYGAASPNKDKIIIIGRFTSYNGVAREKIARLNADGTLDTTWIGPNFTGGSDYLYCVEILKDDKILIGGGFTLPGNIKNIVQLNPDGTIDQTFNPVISPALRGTSGPVHAITAQYNAVNTIQKIYIGGDFTTYNTITNRRLHRLLPDGTPDPSYNPSGTVDGEIRAIAIQKKAPNLNKVIIGGFFNAYKVGSVIRQSGRVLRFDSTGEIDLTFNGGNVTATGGTCVFDIAVTLSDYIYAVGSITKYNSTLSHVGIVKLNPQGIKDPSWDVLGGATGPANQTIFTVAVQPDNKVLIGGTITRYNSTNNPANYVTIPKGIARLSPIGILDDTFLTGTGFQGGTDVYLGTSVIRDIQQQSDTKIITGGDFTIYDGTPRRMIARIKTRVCSVAAVYNGALGWSNGIEPTGDIYYMAIASGTYTVPTGTDMTVCELEVKAGATLVIENNASLTVKGIVMNNGTFKMDSGGSLVQIKDDPNADQGAGVFRMKRETTPVNRFDYTYWSSPVEEQILHAFSPDTLLDKFWQYDSTAGWQNIYDNTYVMVPGKGYIVRAPQTSSMTAAAPITLTFAGRVNNGQVNVPVTVGTKLFNLIGNPYPSAVDAMAFLNDTDNDNVIGGSIYLWTHNTPINPGNQIYQYASNDYMVYNKTGTTTAKPTGVDFNGYIAAGQAFFVQAIADGNVKFLNTMRRTGTNVNSQFLRATNNSTVQNDVRATNESAANRLWLNLTNTNGAFKQILVGFMEGATNGIDRSYDAAALNGNTFINMYSIAEGQKLSIQGRAMPFDATQIIPLGFSTTVAGTFNISLGKFDGVFQSQDVYLLDNLTGEMQPLKGASYTFTTASGTFDNRFELHFGTGMETMKTNAVAANDVIVVKEGKEISVKSTVMIKEASVYDVAGKLLYHNTNVGAMEMITNNLNMQTGMAIVRMTLENNQQITKKILVE